MAFLASATPSVSSSFTSFVSLANNKRPQIILNNAKPKQPFKMPPSKAARKGDETPRNASPESVEISPWNLDRRNMLLGMGGSLCGVANTIMRGDQVAIAKSINNTTRKPIPYFSPSNCGEGFFSDDTPNAALDPNRPLLEKYCPPDFVKRYKIPDKQVMRVRQPAHSVDADYTEKYTKAIQAMKDLPDDDPRSFKNQANVHTAYCNFGYRSGVIGDDGKEIRLQVRASWLFLPFHRWYLYFFEKIAGKLIGDPAFALPYWNWDAPCGMTIPYIFAYPQHPLDSSKENPLFNERRNQDHLPPKVVDLSYSPRAPEVDIPDIQKVCNNLAIMYRQMATSIPTNFMGHPFYLDGKTRSGPGALEVSPHAAVHLWTGTKKEENPGPDRGNGENMGNFYSAARDPIFYSHHANVDRLWKIWSSSGGGRRNFDDEAWLKTLFFFYDEHANPVYVTIEDCLKNNGENLGYTYKLMEMPWRSARPVARKRKSQIAKISGAPRVDNVPSIKLDKVFKVLVPRSRMKRSAKEKEEEEEMLVLEGIQLPSDKQVSFVVQINDDDEQGDRSLDKAEFSGMFSSVPRKYDTSGYHETINKCFELTEVLEDLECEDDQEILVTLIPTEGCDDVTIETIKIGFEKKLLLPEDNE